jgi:hypothetical protein
MNMSYVCVCVCFIARENPTDIYVWVMSTKCKVLKLVIDRLIVKQKSGEYT